MFNLIVCGSEVDSLAAQDCIVERMASPHGEVLFFSDEKARDDYKAHVGLSDHGTDPLTGRAWGRK